MNKEAFIAASSIAHPKLKQWLFVLLFVSLGLVIFESQIVTVLQKLKIVKTPEAYAELYLTYSPIAPETPSIDEKVTLAYVIHNQREGAYAYQTETQVYTQEGEEVLSQTQNILMSEKETREVNESFTYTSNMEGGAVTIRLINNNQFIHFTLPATIH